MNEHAVVGAMATVGHPRPQIATDDSPRRPAGTHAQPPTRIRSFFRQNQNSLNRLILLPIIYASLTSLYFRCLLFRDEASMVHIFQEAANVTVVAPVSEPSGSGSPVAARPAPRSLADVTIANAVAAAKHEAVRRDYLQRRERRREEQIKKREEVARLRREAAEAARRGNGTERRSDSATSREGERDAAVGGRRLKPRKSGRISSDKVGENEGGSLPLIFVVAMFATFRILLSLIVRTLSPDDYFDDALDDESDVEDMNPDADGNSNVPTTGRAGRAGLSSLVAALGPAAAARGGATARRRLARRRFQRFADRLNAARTARGERPLAASTLRGLVGDRDFDGNDYDRLHDFAQEAGPAAGSWLAHLGATEAEIGRCPMRELEAGDDLLCAGLGAPGRPPPACAVCLEPYQAGELVRTIPCFHTFHVACIDPWLAQRAECPICKHSAIG